MSTDSSEAATYARTPSRRGKRGSGCKSGSRRSKPSAARYLYDDDDNNTAITKPCMDDNNVSSLSLEPDESIVGANDSCSSLGGFAMAPCEDEKSELTCKVHNLTSVKYGRKFPKHHSGYHHRQQYEFQQYCRQAWQEGKRVRFQENNNNNQDNGSAIPLGALTKDSLISMMEANDSMRFGNNALHALNDYGEESVGSDAEYPTNASIGSETRSTAGSSAFDDEEQSRFTNSFSCEEDDDDDNDDRILDSEPFSIGNTTHRTKRGLLTKKYLPSASTISRVFFFLGCVLTLWIAIESLTWARWQHQNTKHNIDNNNNETPIAFHQTRRLTRGLSASSSAIKIVVGKEVTHQDQWNDNSNQWDQLQKYQQESWSELGYTQEQWDNQDDVSSENVDWDKLTEDQQDAAEDLGFTQSTWDHFNTNQTSDIDSRESDQQQEQQIANTATATDIQSPTNDTISTTPKTYPLTSTPPMTSSYSFREKDPVVFTTGSGGIPITRHMILSFTASLCFAIVGVMEWIQHDFLFQLLLAISGVWGLLASMFGNRNPGASIAFHTLSVHCFFASSVAILWLRCRQQQQQQPSPSPTPAEVTQSPSVRVANQTQEEVFLLADLCFAVGSAMMVVSSYLTLSYGADEVALLVDIQRFDVFAAILWVGCALIYACCAYKASTQEVA